MANCFVILTILFCFCVCLIRPLQGVTYTCKAPVMRGEEGLERLLGDLSYIATTIATEAQAVNATKDFASNLLGQITGINNVLDTLSDLVRRQADQLSDQEGIVADIQQQIQGQETLVENQASQLTAMADQAKALGDRNFRYPVELRLFHTQHQDGHNLLTASAAEELCRKQNSSLATFQQLAAAASLGYESCQCGWLRENVAYYVVQYGYPGCGGDHIVGPAVVDCEPEGDLDDNLYDAYCFRNDFA